MKSTHSTVDALTRTGLSRGALLFLLVAVTALPFEVEAASVRLTWKAPSDSGGGRVCIYDIRYDTVAITDANWGQAAQVTDEPIPKSPGSVELFEVKGLTSNVLYYFAMKSADGVGNWSDLSNPISCVSLILSTLQIQSGSDTLQFSAFEGGGNPSPQTFTVSELSGGKIPFTATENASWMALSSSTDSTPALITVNVTITGLSAGYYLDSIVITSSGASNSPFTISVSLVVLGRSSQSVEIHPSPNPFRIGETSDILFTGSPANVTILTLSGEVVRSWKNSSTQEVRWDGRNQSGQFVASGIYLWYANDGAVKGKIMLIR